MAPVYKPTDFGFEVSVQHQRAPVFEMQTKSYCVLSHGDEYKLSLWSQVGEHRVSAVVSVDGVKVANIVLYPQTATPLERPSSYYGPPNKFTFYKADSPQGRAALAPKAGVSAGLVTVDFYPENKMYRSCGSMQIFVRASLMSTVFVNPSTLVLELKHKLRMMPEIGVPVKEQILFFERTLLSDDEKSLESYGVGPGVIVNLVGRLRGGVDASSSSGLRLADDDEPYVWVSGEEADSSESSGSFGHSLKQGCTALGAPSSQTFWKAEAFEGYTAAVTQTSRLVCLETPTSPGEVQRAVPMPTVALKNMIPEW